MLRDIVSSIRYSSVGLKVFSVAVTIAGLIYSVSMLLSARDNTLVEGYMGFMKQDVCASVLPVCLMLACLGHVRFGTFELVRRNPVDEFKDNVVWLAVTSGLCALFGGLVFTGVECLVKHRLVAASDWSLAALVVVQCLMMNCVVGLMQLVLACAGFAIEYVTAVLIAFFAVASWLLLSFEGDAARVVCYFWYPISPRWRDVALFQIVPCLVCCTLLGVAAVVLFNTRDRLGD